VVRVFGRRVFEPATSFRDVVWRGCQRDAGAEALL